MWVESYVQPATWHLNIITTLFPFSGWSSRNKDRHVLGWIMAGVSDWVRFRDAFEDAGLLKEFIDILDNINSTPIIVERYRLPSVLIRTFVYDSFNMLDDFVREHRGYVGKVMDIIVEELWGLLYEVLEEGDDFGGE
jgi:hypothetical protein